MRPDTSRSLALLITTAATIAVLRTYDPEVWKPIGAILSYWWIIVPAWIAYTIIDMKLMEWFGKRDADGKTLTYTDPVQDRLDNIEAAINRLHEYVQEIDPELQEELRLERELMSETGGMFAGMTHMEYVTSREKAGKRTRYSRSIWRDDETVTNPSN